MSWPAGRLAARRAVNIYAADNLQHPALTVVTGEQLKALALDPACGRVYG